MKRYWVIWMAFLVAAISAQGQEVSANLDQDKIKIGEQTTITFEIRVPAATKNIMMPALQDTISKFIEILEISDIDTTFDEEDISTKIFTQTITVTSWDSGFHVIPPFSFVIDSDTLETQASLLSVQTIVLEDEQDIKDIKKIIEVPFSILDWILSNRILIGGILFALILLIIAFIIYKKYQNRPKEVKPDYIPKEAADTVAHRKLDELKEKKLWQNDKVKEYYSEISFIVREYIENRFHLRALEQTTDEIIELLKNSPEVNKEHNNKLHNLLLTADMAKYAKQKPLAGENEDTLKYAYDFIKVTAIKEKEEFDNDEEDLPTKKKIDA